MPQYVIERYVGRDDPATSNGYHDWMPAYGLKRRSYPEARNNNEASARFELETRRARRGTFRLKVFAGCGYGVRAEVIATKTLGTAATP